MARASRSKRCLASGLEERCEGRILMATVRSRRVSRARYTSPLASSREEPLSGVRRDLPLEIREPGIPPCNWRMHRPSSYLPTGEPAQAAGIGCSGLCQLIRGRRGNRLHIFRSETQQRSDVPYLVEFRIIFHVEGFDVTADDPRKNGLAHVHHFLRGPATSRTEADEVGIDVPASAAFDGVRLQIFADQKRLHLSELDRAQHAAQSRDSSSITPRATQ